MQGFALQYKLRLTGGIELFLGSVAGGNMFLAGQHLARRGEGTNQNALCIGNLRLCRSFDGGCGTGYGYMPEFLPQYCGVDSQFLCDLLSELVPNNTAGYALDMGQQIFHRFI